MERLKEVYEQTEHKVSVGGEMGKAFWTAREVRQGCPLSTKLFVLLLADLYKRMERKGKGGVEVGGNRLFALAYADDLVILAREKGGMKLIMRELREYLREKGLEVNTEK